MLSWTQLIGRSWGEYRSKRSLCAYFIWRSQPNKQTMKCQHPLCALMLSSHDSWAVLSQLHLVNFVDHYWQFASLTTVQLHFTISKTRHRQALLYRPTGHDMGAKEKYVINLKLLSKLSNFNEHFLVLIIKKTKLQLIWLYLRILPLLCS